MSTRLPRPPRSVAVVRFGALGDIVLTSGATAALRRAWPEARIVFVTKAAFADLVSADPALDEVVALAPGEGFTSLWRRVRDLEPEALLDLHGKLRSRALDLLVPTKRSARWSKRSWTDAVGVRLGLRTYRAERQIAERFHQAVERLVGETLPRQALHHHPPPLARTSLERRLASLGIPADATLVGMAPGAAWATKRWPLESYVELAQHARAKGAVVVVTGSAGEAPLAETIAIKTPGAIALAGLLTLGETSALIDRCRVFVANDSGPMHVARALGVPTLTFFGSTDPRQFDFTGHAMMFAGLECSPCSLHGLERCPKTPHRCMTDLGVAEAKGHLDSLLNVGRRAPLVG